MNPAAAVPALSVCIPSWNTRALLADCLRSLQADIGAGRCEVLVVDDASSDGSAAMVAADFPQVRLTALSTNLGFVGATNLAMRNARGHYLVLLNSDTCVHPGALTALADFMASQPGAGVVGPRLESASGSLQLSCGRTPGLAAEIINKLLLHKLLPFHRFGRWDHAGARRVGWVTGACLVVRRQVAEQVGYLDPGIFMFYEDLEWCLRIQRAGWQIWYCPAGVVTHLGGQSTRQDFGRMLVISQRSQYYLFGRHFSRGTLHLLRLLTVIEAGLRSLIWGGVWGGVPRRRGEARQRVAAYAQILRRTLTDRSYWDSAADRGGGALHVER